MAAEEVNERGDEILQQRYGRPVDPFNFSYYSSNTIGNELVMYGRKSGDRRKKIAIRVPNTWFIRYVVFKADVNLPGSRFVDRSRFPVPLKDPNGAVTWVPVTRSHPSYELIIDALRSSGFKYSHCITDFGGWPLAMLEDPSYNPDVPGRPKCNVLCVRLAYSKHDDLDRNYKRLHNLVSGTKFRGIRTEICDSNIDFATTILEPRGWTITGKVSALMPQLIEDDDRILPINTVQEEYVMGFGDMKFNGEGYYDEPVVLYADFEQSSHTDTGFGYMRTYTDHMIMCAYQSNREDDESELLIMDNGEFNDLPPIKTTRVTYNNEFGFWLNHQAIVARFNPDIVVFWNGLGYDIRVWVERATTFLNYDDPLIARNPNNIISIEELFSEAAKPLVANAFAAISGAPVDLAPPHVSQIYGKPVAYIEKAYTISVPGMIITDALLLYKVIKSTEKSYALDTLSKALGLPGKDGPTYQQLSKAYRSCRAHYIYERCMNGECDHPTAERHCIGSGMFHTNELGKTMLTRCRCDKDRNIVATAISLDTKVHDVPVEFLEDVDDDCRSDSSDQVVESDSDDVDAKPEDDVVVERDDLMTNFIDVGCTRVCNHCRFAANRSNFSWKLADYDEYIINIIFRSTVDKFYLYDRSTAARTWERAYRYVDNDVTCMRRIIEKMKIIAGVVAMCNMCRTPIAQIIAGQSTRVGRILWAVGYGEFIYSTSNPISKDEDKETYGGLVTPPYVGRVKGFPDNDFSGMYPAQMRETNMSSECNLPPYLMHAFMDRYSDHLDEKGVPKMMRRFDIVGASDRGKVKLKVRQVLPITHTVNTIVAKGPKKSEMTFRFYPWLRIVGNVPGLEFMHMKNEKPHVNTDEACAVADTIPAKVKLDNDGRCGNPVVDQTVDSIMEQMRSHPATFSNQDPHVEQHIAWDESRYANVYPTHPDHTRIGGLWQHSKQLYLANKEEWNRKVKTANATSNPSNIPGKNCRWFLVIDPITLTSSQGGKTVKQNLKIFLLCKLFYVDGEVLMKPFTTYALAMTNIHVYINDYQSHYYIRKTTGIRGVFAKMEDVCVTRRAEIKSEMKKYEDGSPEYIDADSRQNACKTTANSGYGVCGAPGRRYKEANQTTITGQCRNDAIGVHSKCVWLGCSVAYGDTDSCFSKPELDIPKSLVRFVSYRIRAALNAHLASYTEYMSVDFDAVVDTIILFAKKKYALLVIGGHEIKYKGLTLVKRDQTPISAQIIKDVIRMAIEDATKAEIVEYIRVNHERVRNMDYTIKENAIMVSKSILLASDESDTPQAKVTHRLRDNGIPVNIGDLVQMFQMRDGTYGSPLIEQDRRHIDLDWVIGTMSNDLTRLLNVLT